MDIDEEIPSKEQQKELISLKLAKSIVAGETWYLISVKWLNALKEYLGMKTDGNEDASHPGPINNDRILTHDLKHLKNSLAETCDYHLISEECWILFLKWYGLCKNQVPIARKAILQDNHSFVEVYPMEIKCSHCTNLSSGITLKISKAELIDSIHRKLRIDYSIHESVASRLWMQNSEGQFVLLKSEELSVQASGVHEAEKLVLDVQLDGKWIDWQKVLAVKTSNNAASQKAALTNRSDSTRVMRLRSTRAAGPSTCVENEVVLPGICGLYNLGMTCFMNAGIQCLSNCPPITQYFLNLRHLSELNTTNPLGMKGELAKSFGELIQVLWSGQFHNTSPSHFKNQIAKFNEQFLQNQHDAQELLTFLLDGLHEDLNRVTNKPYVENICDCGDSDEIAKEIWENYKMRNDSIIVDTFHGLLKSRVVCPSCERLSVTYDPFCTLSLPLPHKKERVFKVRFIPCDPKKREAVYCVSDTTASDINDLCQEISSKTEIPPENMVVAGVHNGFFHKFFPKDASMESVEDKEHLFVYEMPNEVKLKGSIIIPVCFWEQCQPEDKFSVSHLFGIPFLTVLTENEMTLPQLVQKVLFSMKRNFRFPESFRCTDFNDDDKSDTYHPNLYVHNGSAINSSPIKLDVNKNGEYTSDLSVLLDPDNNSKVYNRKALIIQLTSEERRNYYVELPPDYRTSRPNSREQAKYTVYNCLDLFTSSEKLGSCDTWLCPGCKVPQRASKKFDLWKVPKMLIIHLKRFSFMRNSEKIKDLVEYPLDDLNLSDYIVNPDQEDVTYSLTGVISHHGNVLSGHCIAYCKNPINKRWYSFNDPHVRSIEPDEILTRDAYVLFYAKNEELPTPTNASSPTIDDL